MKKIITTVGTSCFTNILHRDKNHKVGVGKYYSKHFENLPYGDWKEQEEIIKELKKATKNGWLNNENDSAEIKSILAIAKELQEEVHVYLLATDTVVSVLACILVKDWFKEKSQFTFKVVTDEKTIVDLTEENKGALVIKDLRVTDDSSATSDETTVNSGFINLIDKIYSILKANNWEKNKKCDEFILNISGGYKAFIPILTVMGQLNEIPLNYIYEGSDQLITIPPFLMQFDWDLAEEYYPFLNKCLLQDEDRVKKESDLIKSLKENSLIVSRDEGKTYQLTALGELLKKHIESINVPHAPQVAGFIAEYKMFEYFHNQKIYSQVERSLNVESEQIDLKLRSQKGEVIVCEVKSFRKIYGNVGKIIERAKARIVTYRKNNENIKGYILVIHKGKFDKIELVSKNLQYIKSKISELGVCCEIFYIERCDNYQRFASEPLKNNDLKRVEVKT